MAYKIGIFNLEKGSGKTTTAVYLAQSFATLNQRVLLVDLDLNSGLKKYLSIRSLDFTVEIRKAESLWKYKTDYETTDNDQAEIIIFDFAGVDLIREKKYLSYIDSVIVPVEAEFYGLDNLTATFKILNEIKDLKIEGLLLTKVDQNNTLFPSLKSFIEENFSGMLLNSTILRNYYLALPHFNIENLNKSIPNFGFADYLKLANEILEKNVDGKI